jgi:hypothetical protein
MICIWVFRLVFLCLWEGLIENDVFMFFEERTRTAKKREKRNRTQSESRERYSGILYLERVQNIP